jgi:hypothetical protein
MTKCQHLSPPPNKSSCYNSNVTLGFSEDSHKHEEEILLNLALPFLFCKLNIEMQRYIQDTIYQLSIQNRYRTQFKFHLSQILPMYPWFLEPDIFFETLITFIKLNFLCLNIVTCLSDDRRFRIGNWIY